MAILTAQVSQRRATSWFSAREPAHAMLNIAVWQGGCAPLRTPSVFRAAAGTAGWRSRRWPPPGVWIPMHISRLSRKSHKLLSYNYLMSTYRLRFPLHFPFCVRESVRPQWTFADSRRGDQHPRSGLPRTPCPPRRYAPQLPIMKNVHFHSARDKEVPTWDSEQRPWSWEFPTPPESVNAVETPGIIN